MLQRVWVAALTLLMAGTSLSPEAATTPARQNESAWLRTDSQRFEIHYPPALSGELDRVVRSAERAYDRISGQLNFVLATKVPLVLFAPSGSMTRERIRAYSASNQVAPPAPHRSRIVLPLSTGAVELDASIAHELTHLLVSEIVQPGQGGDGGVPRWVHEGAASYMAGVWSDDHERLMCQLVASGDVPALSRLVGGGGFADGRVNEAIGRAAFDYIESRWGAMSIRGFLNALIVPRVDRTYDAVFELTPAEFDAAFRQYAERRFKSGVR